MKTKLLLIAIIAFLVFSCKENKSKNRAEKQTTTLGFINPITGELATYGEAVKRGVDLALSKVNEKSLLKSGTLKIIMEDSKGETKTGVTSLQKLINIDGAKYIIGGISSNVTLAMLPVTEKNNVFLFSPGAASPKLTDNGKLFARNWPSNNEEANSAASYSYDILNYKKASIVFVNSDWGLGLMENFEKKFIALGGEIVDKQIYSFGNTDFKTLLLKINKGADFIYLAGNQKEMGHFTKQLRQRGIMLPLVSNTSFLVEDCLNIAGDAAEGVIVPTPAYDPKSSNEKIQEFYKGIQTKYNITPSLAEANGYDIVMLIVEAINNSGDNPKKVAEYIRNLKNYEGAGGNVSFTNGDVSRENVFKIIKNGKVEAISNNE
jgi:branched-chain amino acid transport system substrate-binding protein